MKKENRRRLQPEQSNKENGKTEKQAEKEFTTHPVNSIRHEFGEYFFDDIVNIDFHKDGITGNSYYVETSGYGKRIYLLDEPYNDYITYNGKIYTWDDLPTLTKEIYIRNIEWALEALD